VGEPEAGPEILAANGIHGRKGTYLIPPVPLDEAARNVAGLGEEPEAAVIAERRAADLAQGVAKSAPGIDEADLSQTGWGVVFNGAPERSDEVAAIREQLRPLLERRSDQAGDLYREYQGSDGYLAGHTALQWMSFHGTGPGTAYPEDMPIHLMIVGSPGEASFPFQYGLDVQRSVGRLHFDDVADYGRYAEQVIRAETDPPTVAPRLGLFGPRNPGDKATALSSSRLIAGLAERLTGHTGWEVDDPVVADAATKAKLGELMAAPDGPGLLFTASHGIGFDAGDELQRSDQGALVCQDWNGDPATMGPDCYFAAADVPDGAGLTGRIGFIFACYGGGTPQLDDFAHRISPDTKRQIAPEPFIARLPQRLLAGGMLAVAAHVDRAWSFSFQWGRARTQIRSFEATLRELMNGQPVGTAFDHMNVRAGELGFYKAELLELSGEPGALAGSLGAWTAANDARNYIVFGDPATRLRTT
jgi:hypothetical protein